MDGERDAADAGDSDDERGGTTGPEGESERRNPQVSEWFKRSPSGWRDGVDETAAKATASRQRPSQNIDKQDRQIRKFGGCQFIAHVAEAMKFDKNGDLIVVMRVPYEFKHLAVPLSDAFGIPMSVDVQVWRPFEEQAG
jgi:hypothetical protein